MTLIGTERPGVYLAESERSPGVFYPITGVGTAFVVCACPAAQHGRACKHAAEALGESRRIIKENSHVSNEERSTAVAIAQRTPALVQAESMRLQVAAQLESWESLKALAAGHIRSGFAPRGVDTAEKGAMIILKAMELGVPATAAYEFIDIIEGRPRIRGQMVGALVERSGKGTIAITETDAQHCVAIGQRPGRPSLRIECRIEDFRQLAQSKQVWKDYPADMLRWKAIARVGRVMFADVLGGMDAALGVEDAGSYDYDTASQPTVGRLDVIDGEYRPMTETGGAESEPERETAHAGSPAERAPEASAADSASPPTADAMDSGAAQELGLPADDEAAVDWWNALAGLMDDAKLKPADMARLIRPRPWNCGSALAYCREKGLSADELVERAEMARDAMEVK